MKKLMFLTLSFVLTNAYAQEPTDEQQIRAMYEHRLEQFQSAPTPEAQADAYVADILDDAVWLPQNAPPVRGKESVRKWSVGFFSQWILEIGSCETEPMLIGDGVAVNRFLCSGTYVERDTGREVPFTQKYVDVLQKQPDGSWKLESHMWSSNDRLASIWSE